MQAARNFFVVLRASGAIAILVLFLYVEWRFIHGNFANAFNAFVQLFVIGSVLILPLFWFLVVITLAGHFGERITHNRLNRPSRKDSESFRSNG